MKISMFALAILLLPARVLAGEHQFANGEAVALRPDEAYILVRTFDRPGGALRGTTKFAPVLIRVLSSDELKNANAAAKESPQDWQSSIESNIVEPLADQPYEESGDEEYLLTSLKPGTYVLGGVAVTNWAVQSAGLMVTSLCMGTVKFEAKPGVITDLGAILTADDDEPADIPELKDAVSGRDRGFGPGAQTVGIRLPTGQLPDRLKSLPVVPANYSPVDEFPNYIGAHISRLAPIPGVLDYDRDGNVIDLKPASVSSGQTPAADAAPHAGNP